MKNTLYLKAPGDWINDPNGFIYYKGSYHLFYQYFPCAPVWGTMHWGHATSPDLVHWTHHGVALYPTKRYDGNGVFSGSAIEVDGKMRLYYTGVRYLEESPDNIHHATASGCYQCQVMIESEDGMVFDNQNGKHLVIPAIVEDELADVFDCRDPKVWREEGRYYMCLATTHRTYEGVDENKMVPIGERLKHTSDKTGSLLIMESADGIHWEPNNRVTDARLGHTLECPDLFCVGDKQILVSSPMGNLTGTDCPYENQATVRFASFNGKNHELSLDDKVQFLDYGFDIYAPQSNVDAEGRRTVISWLRMPMPESPECNSASNGRPWNGMMCLPRVVEVRDGRICTPVHPNVREYFSMENAKIVKAGVNYREMEHHGKRQILTTIKNGEIIFVCGMKISMEDGCVCTDRSRLVPESVQIHRTCRSPYIGEECQLEIYVEPNIIEIYMNDGEYVITNWKHAQAIE